MAAATSAEMVGQGGPRVASHVRIETGLSADTQVWNLSGNTVGAVRLAVRFFAADFSYLKIKTSTFFHVMKFQCIVYKNLF